MYSKPPPLNIPFAPSMPSYAAMAAAPRMYGAPGKTLSSKCVSFSFFVLN